MLGFSFFEIFVIGLVALVVLGPEKLPRTARTIGALIGKAQRYVNEVKSEVNRAIDLEELSKMKSSIEEAAQGLQTTLTSTADDFEQTWASAIEGSEFDRGADTSNTLQIASTSSYSHRATVKKNWRIQRGRTPKWFKQQTRKRLHVQSAAARVARHSPRRDFL